MLYGRSGHIPGDRGREGREERTIIYMSELDRELELVTRRCDWLELIE